MSAHAISWARDLPGETERGLWCTLLVMGDHANSYGLVKDTVPNLAGMARCAERTFQYHMRQAEEAGLVLRLGRHGDEGGPAENVYVLGMDRDDDSWRAARLQSLKELAGEGVVQRLHHPGAIAASSGVRGATVAPPFSYLVREASGVVEGEATTTPPDSPTGNEQQPTKKPDAPELWMWQVLKEAGVVGRHQLTGTRKQKLRAMHDEQLAQLPDDQRMAAFKRIMSDVLADPFYRESPHYMLPESLFKNTERREKHAGRAHGGGTAGAAGGSNGAGPAAPGSKYKGRSLVK